MISILELQAQCHPPLETRKSVLVKVPFRCMNDWDTDKIVAQVQRYF